MKKILLALAGLCFASTALAGPMVAPHSVFVQAKWRTHKAALVGTELNAGVDNLGGYVDSLTIQRAGALQADTTAAFSTVGSTTKPTSAVTGDSLMSFVFSVYDAGNTTLSASTDSIYVQAQGSDDGKNWTTLSLTPVTGTGPAANLALPGAALPTTIPMISASGSNKNPRSWKLKFVENSAVAGQRNMSDIYSMRSWNNIRFIVYQAQATTVQYNLAAKLHYWSADEDLNK